MWSLVAQVRPLHESGLIDRLVTVAFATAVGLALASLVAALSRQARATSTSVVEWSLVRRDNRRRALSSSIVYRLTLPLVRMCIPLSRTIFPLVTRSSIIRWYPEAGCPGGYTDEELPALAMVISLVLSASFAYLGITLAGIVGAVFFPAGFLLGPLLVSSLFEGRAKHRRLLFDLSFPYAIDLLVLTLRSGTSLKMSLAKLVNDYDKHPIGEEFGQVLADVQMGMARKQALGRLTERVRSDDIRSLVDSLNQAEELGWPLADTIERLADRMNQARLLNAQEIAGAAGVKVMLPATLILMAALLLLFGPTITRALRGDLSL